MASPLPSSLVVGHSFVKRLHDDLQCKFDLRAALDFNLTQTATLSLHGIGGLTVPRLARNYGFYLLTGLFPGSLSLRSGQMI